MTRNIYIVVPYTLSPIHTVPLKLFHKIPFKSLQYKTKFLQKQFVPKGVTVWHYKIIIIVSQESYASYKVKLIYCLLVLFIFSSLGLWHTHKQSPRTIYCRKYTMLHPKRSISMFPYPSSLKG